ncbi:MAG: hypothetical protein HQL71_09300 [Magnetococcales bacterium]|nr:hypothetical protein [Magnetococcales bacterium]
MDASNMRIKLYFPRWKFSYNLGDTVMLSCLFKAMKEHYRPQWFEVIGDDTMVELFQNDPYVDHFRAASWLEKKTLKFYGDRSKQKNPVFLVLPEWNSAVFEYLAIGDNLQRMIEHPKQNILSLVYAQQINTELFNFDDLRPRIHLTPLEINEAESKIGNNSIAIHVADIRGRQKRDDGEKLRYSLASWQRLIAELKTNDPTLKIYEVGSHVFHGLGDEHIPPGSIRKLAAQLNSMKLVVLSDGGIHNLCNAIDKKVVLFQGYEWNPPDMFKLGNGLFNEDIHLECRKKCHIYSDILKIDSASKSCKKECYDLNPILLAKECNDYLGLIATNKGSTHVF